MKWATRERIRIDRAASGWLILRFVDKDAEFEFVPTKGALELAQASKAIPFVIPGAELSRREGKVTFDAILEKYELTDPALHKLALIVREADISGAAASVSPEAPGLRAILHGFFLLDIPDLDTLRTRTSHFRRIVSLLSGEAGSRLAFAKRTGIHCVDVAGSSTLREGHLDQLLVGRDPKEVLSKDGLFDELKKALAERILKAELDDHLGGELADGKLNHRNGYSKKSVLTESSKLDIKVPRDREGIFDLKLIARYQRRFPGFDEKIVSMYARGMTVREIQGHLLEIYGLDVSPDLISTVTDAVLETVGEWQNRPLEQSYPLVFFDALRVKIRDEGLVSNKAVYIALGVQADETKDILGLWIENTEGASSGCA